jgi:hypothetical protein
MRVPTAARRLVRIPVCSVLVDRAASDVTAASMSDARDAEARDCARRVSS